MGSGVRDEYLYVLVGKRERFKDRLNKKAWTLVLSGSQTAGSASKITLTDDSVKTPAVATPGGPRYNIVSGALGVPSSSNAAAYRTFGWFYPEMGMMVFSGHELSASINGHSSGSGDANPLLNGIAALGPAGGDVASGSSGFAPNTGSTGNKRNYIKFVQCMKNMESETSLRLRSEEDQTQENYFCRIRAEQYNFSANPTFVSGSKNKIRNLDMHGNPQTFITGVGLYNSSGQLLAIAKLSSPLKKNFASEATIKVKLTY